jgi:hypothetical protein
MKRMSHTSSTDGLAREFEPAPDGSGLDTASFVFFIPKLFQRLISPLSLPGELGPTDVERSSVVPGDKIEAWRVTSAFVYSESLFAERWPLSGVCNCRCPGGMDTGLSNCMSFTTG